MKKKNKTLNNITMNGNLFNAGIKGYIISITSDKVIFLCGHDSLVPYNIRTCCDIEINNNMKKNNDIKIY